MKTAPRIWDTCGLRPRGQEGSSIKAHAVRVAAAFLLVFGSGCHGFYNTLTVKKFDGTTLYSYRDFRQDNGPVLAAGDAFPADIRLFDADLPDYNSVDYTTETYRSEVELYAEDPRAFFAQWDAHAFDESFYAALSNVDISTPMVLAKPMFPPYTPPAGAAGISASIYPGAFYPWDPGRRVVPWSHAIFYNYGRCAREASLEDDIFPTIAENIAETIGDRRRDRTAKVEVYSFVGFDDMAPLGGGFLIYISGRIPTIWGSADVQFTISRRYLYVLQSGVLTIQLDKAQDDVSHFKCVGSGVCGIMPGVVHGTVIAGLDDPDGGLVAQFNRTALSRQSIQLVSAPNPGEPQCPSHFACPDAVSAFALDLALVKGVDKIATTFSMSSGDEEKLLEQARLTAKSPDNWTCAKVTDSVNVCKFLARAEQLNVFPNALQLVLLKEYSTGAWSGAVAAAAAYSQGAAQVRSACNAQHQVELAPFPSARPFVGVVREYP
jgi:hypothetical protein